MAEPEVTKIPTIRLRSPVSPEGFDLTFAVPIESVTTWEVSVKLRPPSSSLADMQHFEDMVVALHAYFPPFSNSRRVMTPVLCYDGAAVHPFHWNVFMKAGQEFTVEYHRIDQVGMLIRDTSSETPEKEKETAGEEIAEEEVAEEEVSGREVRAKKRK